MSSLVVRCLTRAVWVKGRVRKQGSKPFVNPDKRTGRLSGSAVKPTSKRIKLAATIVGTSESSSPIRQRPKGASLSSKSSSNPEDGGAPSALSIRRRALVQRLQSDAGSRHEIELSEPSYARKTSFGTIPDFPGPFTSSFDRKQPFVARIGTFRILHDVSRFGKFDFVPFWAKWL